MATNGHDNDDRRVVVTGMSAITTIGESLAEYLDALKHGQSGITRWKNVDARTYSKIGGDMSDFDMQAHFRRVGRTYPYKIVQNANRILRAAPHSSRLAASAALQAYDHAGLTDGWLQPERIGHVLAGHNLHGTYIDQNLAEYEKEPEYIDPLFGLNFLDTTVLSEISEMLHLQGPSYSVGGACASGNLALLTALDLLRAGRADIILVTGGPFTMGSAFLQSWAIMEAISWQSFNDQPSRASRPFDRRREGFVPSEGAGAVVLETLASARGRGARVYAELLGAASTSDAARPTKPSREGQARVMRAALKDARIIPDQVDYINAHATSSQVGDAVEVQAIKAVFKDHAHRIPVNSTKSLIGHCITSSGIIDFVTTILQMANDFVHPTINQEEPDPELDLDFVPNQAREHHINYAISNAFGFGGLNASVVVGWAP